MDPYLIDSPDDGSHGGVSWSVDSSSIVGGAPTGRVDVN